MESKVIRQKFLDFFAKRDHAIVPSSSLIPDDPSVLLTTAGMQQFKLYFTGDRDAMADFGKLSATSCQKSFRTSDIDEVGDERHLTFFEMLGNFSFGGYFKKEAITYAYEFITKEMGLPISYVTIFKGKEDIGVPKDTESAEIWKSLDPNIEIREEGMEDVFWGPTGSSGPCGPTTEIYCKNGAGQDIEVWNVVFNQFFYNGSREELNVGTADKKLEPLKTPGVDTGMGLERLAMCVQNSNTVFEIDLFREIFGILTFSNHKSGRIIADHLRASVFLIGDGVRPSNKGAGYILRRLIRRAVVQADRIGEKEIIEHYIENIINYYGNFLDYYNLVTNKNEIIGVIKEEVGKFEKTLAIGLHEVQKKYPEITEQDYIPGEPLQLQETGKIISGEDAFNFHQSYGFTIDILKDLAEGGLHIVDEKGFEKEFKKHQEVSRAGLEKKFGGHGLILDTGELKAANEEELKKVTRLHTVTHMLQQALREVLGPEVQQAGSDITIERTRFDFSFPRKMTPEEIKAVEEKVNEKIKEDLPMQKVELPKAEAEKTGALYFFKAKYPDTVNVYFIGKDLQSAWSKEFCGGPHVTHTGEIGKFKITKEEAVSAGVRRIRGVVEP